MKYFVSIENIPYHHWQVHLLIESFKKHHLEADLVIAIANNNGQSEYIHSLQKHKNIFFHDNFTPKIRNKPHSLLIALENKVIQPPFTLLHPDMVLFRPVNPPQYDITFSPNFENFKKYSIPLGDVVVFGEKITNEFFKKFCVNSDHYQDLRMGLAATILNTKNITLGTDDLEQNLLHHNQNSSFIHYQHGILPDWSKYEFKTSDIPDKLPYRRLLQHHNHTSATEYVCRLFS